MALIKKFQITNTKLRNVFIRYILFTFSQEEEYEWGNPKSKDKIPEPNGEIENAIAAAAYRWRLKLQKQQNSPFSDIVALLMVSEEKYDQFKRLIEAGGGSVMQARCVLINFRKNERFPLSIIVILSI